MRTMAVEGPGDDRPLWFSRDLGCERQAVQVVLVQVEESFSHEEQILVVDSQILRC